LRNWLVGFLQSIYFDWGFNSKNKRCRKLKSI
jgi:hypothetical protein